MSDQVLTTTLRITADTSTLRTVASGYRDVGVAAREATRDVARFQGQGVLYGPRGEVVSTFIPGPAPAPSPASPTPGAGGGGNPFRRGGSLAGFGVAGMMGYRALGQISGAVSEFYSSEAALQGGLASGSLPTALNAVIQARATREMARNQMFIGGSTGALSAGGMAVSAGLMTANPMAGAAVAIGSALLGIAGQWGTAAANSMVSTLAAKEQAAVGFGEKVLATRMGMSEDALVSMLYGRGLTTGDFNTGASFGYGAPRLQSMARSFLSSGGLQTDVGMLSASARAGISPDLAGRFQRAFAPGMGATSDMGLWGQLDKTVTHAVNSGVSRSRVADYLSRISSFNERYAEQGLLVNYSGHQMNRTGMFNAGLLGFQGEAALGSMQDMGVSILRGMSSDILPAGMVQALVKSRLFSKFGGYGAAMTGLQGMLEGGTFPQFLTELGGSLPGLAGTSFFSEISGLLPGSAGKVGGFRPSSELAGGLQPSLFGGFWESIKGVATGLMATPEGGLLSRKAQADTMEAFTIQLGKLNAMIEKSFTLIDKAGNVFEESYGKAMQKLDDQLSHPERYRPGVGTLIWGEGE